jgi:hypothetical protein
MKALTNSAVKLLAAAMFVSTAVAYDRDVYRCTYSQSGSGSTRADALVSSLQNVPYGAKIEKINLNGSSTKQYVQGVGYIQTSGSYKCKIYYSK